MGMTLRSEGDRGLDELTDQLTDQSKRACLHVLIGQLVCSFSADILNGFFSFSLVFILRRSDHRTITAL